MPQKVLNVSQQPRWWNVKINSAARERRHVSFSFDASRTQFDAFIR